MFEYIFNPLFRVQNINIAREISVAFDELLSFSLICG